MKCIQVLNVNNFIIKETPLKDISNDEVIIKVCVTGLCRTDLKIIQYGHRDLILPRIPGEEVVGVVYKKGKNVNDFQEGDNVYVYPGFWCGECEHCLKGAENLCNKMQIMGFHRDGGFAEYVSVPSKTLIKIPDGISMEQAVFAEPLSCCLNAIELGGIKPDMNIGIWGAGPAGTLLSRLAKAFHANPFSIEPDENRRKLINGYKTCPDKKFDICIVAVGDINAYNEALTSLNSRGRLVIFSGLPKPNEKILINFNMIHYLEQSIAGAYGCCFKHGIKALNMIANKQIIVDDMISHKMSLFDLNNALKLVAERQCMKIHLYP